MAATAPPPSAPGWLARWSPAAALRRRFRAWWQGRLKRTDTLELTQRNVYILPTGPGWMLAVTLVVLLIASINFQLNLGYLFTFMLAGSAVIGMHISHATLRGLTLHLKQPQPQFMGSSAALEVQLTSQRSTPRYGIGIAVHGGDDPSTHADHHWAWTDVPAQGQAVVHIAFQPQRRGLHPVPTLTAETRFPLGTFRVWTYWRPAAQLLVYPAPESTPPPPAKASVSLTACGPTAVGIHSNSWSGKRPPNPWAAGRMTWSAATRNKATGRNCGWTWPMPSCPTWKPASHASPPGCCKPTGWAWTTACVCRGEKSPLPTVPPTACNAWKRWRCAEQYSPCPAAYWLE